MSEANKAVVRRLLEEVWGKGNLALVPELMAADCVCHVATDGVTINGAEEYRAHVAARQGIFGDTGVTVADQVAEGDRVATRWTTLIVDAEHGDGAPPEMAIVMAFHRLVDGKIVESWATWDIRETAQLDAEPDALDRLSLNF
jgi:predicted ester cyclase